MGCIYLAIENVKVALEYGISIYDTAMAGLGGCPYAKGASGNVATEDVVMMAEQMGYDTGIDMDALLRASDLAIELTGTAQGGKAKAWLQQYQSKSALAG